MLFIESALKKIEKDYVLIEKTQILRHSREVTWQSKLYNINGGQPTRDTPHNASAYPRSHKETLRGPEYPTPTTTRQEVARKKKASK